ncbi:MAG: hypothetical protein CR979_03660, partial [Propionibacterium sp.]
DGFTLVAEQLSVLFSVKTHVKASWYLEKLHSNELEKEVISRMDDITGQMRHRDKLLSIVLADSLADLGEEEIDVENLDFLSLEQVVLLVASQLPPDNIPWQWLEEILFKISPNIPKEIDGEPTMELIKDKLTGRQLLTQVTDETYTMHRMVSEKLSTWTPELLAEITQKYWWNRAEILKSRSVAAHGWEISALIDTISDWFNHQTNHQTDKTNTTNYLLTNLPDIFIFADQYLTDTRIKDLIKTLNKTAKPNSKAHSISLTLLGKTLQSSDPDTALDLYRQSLEISQRLAESAPDNRDAQRNLLLSLNNVAGVLQSSDPDTALGYYQQSLEISQRLAESAPDNRNAQRDLSLSLEKVAGVLQSSDPDTALGYYQQSLEI